MHFVPALNKSCAIWALGLLHLICLFHFASRTYHTQVWQRRLQNLGINPESYTFVFFQCTAVAYLKMQFNLPNSASLSYEQAGRFYIGPTSIGMAKREFDRMAKFRLAKDGTLVHVELAVKYWCCTDFVIIWNSQRVVEPEKFLHQPWSSEIWRSQNWIVQRPCHFWHTPIFQHKFQDFYAIMSWSTRKLQFRCVFQPQNWGKLQHRRFQVFYIITRSMSTSTLYRIRPGWRVRALDWLPKFRKIWHEQLQYWTKFHGCPPFSHEDLQAELLRQWTAHTKELHDNPGFSFQNIERLLQWYVDDGFILFDHRFRSALPMQVLSDCFFYQAPMELETVQDGTLLGFTIDMVQRTVRYQVPPLWKIRDLRSAGSVRLRLSGLKSRATLIRRYTFLEQFVCDDLDQLIQLYVQKGFSKNGLPTRLVQKAVRAYLNFWLWKVATDMLMRLQMFQCGFLQITCWCLASTQLKEHKPGYVPFCVCQALY